MGYPAPAAQSLVVDREGTVWVATDGFDFGLSPDEVRKNTILTLARDATHFSTTGDAVGMIGSMSVGSDGSVWIVDVTDQQVRRVDPARRSSEVIALDQAPAGLAFGIDGSVWVGLFEGGLRRLPRIGPNVRVERFSTRDQLSGSRVHAALRDREGNLWFGTSGGLDRFCENKVMAFSETEGLGPELSFGLASTPDGSVWLFSYATNAIYRFFDGALRRLQLDRYSRSDSTRSLAIHVNAKGHLWLGGSFKLARESQGTFTYLDVPDRVPQSSVEAVAEDNTGQLWVTMTSSSSPVRQILRGRGAKWTDVRANSSLPQYRCRVLHPDAAGRMWMGFENGEVVVFDGGASRLYSTTDGLPGGRVLTIVDDREARVWVGSQMGLSLLERDHFVTLTQDNGLLGSSISAIVEDDDGNFWLAGALGIMRVERSEMETALSSATYRIRGLIFDAADGLRGLPRQREPFPTATRAADGRLWFATSDGVAWIDPHHWPHNALPPPVQIEKVIADDREQDTSGRLSLPPRTRNVEIHFAALSLAAPERNRYRYKLEGYDPDWRTAVRARTATYTNLPPRNYRFRVIASNNDGVWNETGATLDFAIVPAFYQTRAFLVFCIAAVGGLAWAGFRWRMRRERSLLQLQFRERLAERTRIAEELHDTLLQGFLSASMQLHVAVEQLPAESPDKPRLQHVIDLMRRVIEEGRNAVRGLRPSDGRSDDLEEAFSRLREDLAPKQGVDYRVIRQGLARPLETLIRDEVYRIGREAVVNAFQHSGANRIEVELDFGAKGLTIAVRDDGRGIDLQLLETGREGHWGLVGMRDRAKRIGAQLKVWSGAGTGTEVELSVPGGIAFQTQSRRRPWGWLAWLYPGRAGDLDTRK